MVLRSILLLFAVAIASVAARHVTRTSHNASDVLPDGYVGAHATPVPSAYRVYVSPPAWRVLPEEGLRISPKHVELYSTDIRGVPAGVGRFPWLVRLVIKSRKEDKTNLCAGTLISAYHVLSAAHCFDLEIESFIDIRIYLGDYDTQSFWQDCDNDRCTTNVKVYADKIYFHPEYNSTNYDNDITILRLRKRAPLSATIKAIYMPGFDLDSPDYEGASVIIAGWGETEEWSESRYLQAAEINLISREKCLAMDSYIAAGHFCAGNPNGKNACPGDSGGPLMMYYKNMWVVAGIMSYMNSNDTCGTATVGFFTNVYKYKEWIKSHT